MGNKRTIKVNFKDYWGSFYNEDLVDGLTINILRKHFDVEVCEDADYVFFSTMGDSHWGVSDKAVKIFQTGENIAPDFNSCDYAISFEWIEYGDRHIRFPNYFYYDPQILHSMEHKHELPAGWNLKKEKTGFCSFTVSNHRNKDRIDVFRRLSEYQHVDSGGAVLNNIGGRVKDKFAFDATHKFTLCFENGAHSGYTTEKLVQALAARTIPIYWGDPDVGKVFNTRAFINANEYSSIDEVIARVKEINEDDDLYMQILREPALLPDAPSYTEVHKQYEAFLLNIINQPLEKSYRRNRQMHGRWYVEKRLKLDSKANRKQIWELRKAFFIKVIGHLKRKFLKRY